MAHYVINQGDTFQFGPAVEPEEIVTPADISAFLYGRGWNEVGNSITDRWRHVIKNRPNMSWEQAVAIEFYEFVSLGGR